MKILGLHADLDREKLYDLYWNQWKSTPELAKMFEVHPRTIRRWLTKFGIKKRWAGTKTIRPNLSPSKTLFYVIGVLLGDGHIFRGQHRVMLGVKDKVFAEKFCHALTNLGFKPLFFQGGRGYWWVHGYSIVFEEWFFNLSYHTIEELMEGNQGFITSLLCGFYESDGNFWNGKHNPILRIFNSNIELITWVHKLICGLGFPAYLDGYIATKSRKPAYRIFITQRKQIKRFLEMVKPCIKLGEVRRRKNPRPTR